MPDFKTNMWPTPEEERANAWRRMSLIAQIVFFVLTIAAIAIFYGFLSLLHLPTWFAAVAAIPLGEFLIMRSHFWRTGVESALWIGGLYAIVFSLPHSGKVEALLVLAIPAAIAGWRVRNALFGTLALVLITAYFAARHWPAVALLFALAVALAALFASTRIWQRPSTEFLWQVIVLVMPVAGYIAQLPARHPVVVVMYLVLATVFAAVGIRFRIRVPLAAAAIAIAIAVIEARLPLDVEVQLIVGGAICLTLAAVLMRALRGKDRGFVIGEPKQSDLEAAMSVAPTLLSVPAAEGGGAPVKPGGGEFGGAGASGNY